MTTRVETDWLLLVAGKGLMPESSGIWEEYTESPSSWVATREVDIPAEVIGDVRTDQLVAPVGTILEVIGRATPTSTGLVRVGVPKVFFTADREELPAFTQPWDLERTTINEESSK